MIIFDLEQLLIPEYILFEEHICQERYISTHPLQPLASRLLEDIRHPQVLRPRYLRELEENYPRIFAKDLLPDPDQILILNDAVGTPILVMIEVKNSFRNAQKDGKQVVDSAIAMEIILRHIQEQPERYAQYFPEVDMREIANLRYCLNNPLCTRIVTKPSINPWQDEKQFDRFFSTYGRVMYRPRIFQYHNVSVATCIDLVLPDESTYLSHSSHPLTRGAIVLGGNMPAHLESGQTIEDAYRMVYFDQMYTI